jgi:hypothetical protein
MPRPKKGERLIGPYAKPKVRCSDCAYRPGTLQLPSDEFLQVDSAQWFNWLQRGLAFRVEKTYYSADITKPYCLSYTVRAERRQRGGVYWYAYKKHNQQRLPTVYLGKTENVTLVRLEEIAWQLLAQINPQLYTEMASQQQNVNQKYHNQK